MSCFPVRTLVASAVAIMSSLPVTGAHAASRPASPQARPGPAAGTGLAARAVMPQTQADLMAAMRGEAFAYASYTFFAAQARREGIRSVARLFRRTAGVELAEHFAREAALARLAGSDAANLRDAIAGEAHEAATMYPEFAKQAAEAGDRDAAAMFTEIASDEADHRDAFSAALDVVDTGHGRVPAPPNLSPVPVPAGGPQVHEQTLANLETAMHGEAFAYAKYMLYARHAAAHDRHALAALFRGTANVELREHFAAEAVAAGLVGETDANLTKAIAAEQHEAQIMYPEFAARAAAAGDIAAARLFRHNARDEADHARAFRRALDRLASPRGASGPGRAARRAFGSPA